MHPEMGYKLCKFCENHSRDTPLAAFIFHILHDQISVKISVLGSCTLIVAPMRVKFGTEEGNYGPLLCAEFHPHWCNVSPLRGKKPQNRPLSNLNTGALRCAQCCW